MPSLAESGLVPDVVDAVASGSGVGLEVAFSGDAPIAGGLLTPASSAAQPAVRITGGAEGELYTLVSADPDGPDPEAPTFREVLHWIVTNIPGGSGDVTAGHEVTPWIGPAPPIGTHRYFFLAFRQPGPLRVADPSGGERAGRRGFKTRAFAQAHRLGDPVAGAWFVSRKGGDGA